MKQAVSVFLSVIFTVWAGIAAAQATFVQIEARPDLNGAQERVNVYADALPDVNGFRMASGWYGVALGPYTEEEAIQALQQLRAQGSIPPDSFLTQSNAYTQQFYPQGGNALTGEPADAPAASDVPSLQGETTETAQADTENAQIPVIEAQPEPEPEPVDPETQQDAYRSEAQLNREQRADLQVALQWFGFYQGAIDAAIGPGTRRSMAAWQESKGLEPTGVLTTMQRARLLEEYNEVLASLGLGTRRDETAGIEVTMPQAMVSFDRYEPPFAHYTPINDSGVTVLLISQTGDESTLLGLYDIMQTLRIVPVGGERERSANSFTLRGENARIRSYTHAVLTGGAVKGFTLIWPAGEDRRFDVALKAMRDSFTPISGVLPDAYGDGALEQRVDLFSGLEIRTPEFSRSGFYIDNRGTVLTTTEAVEGCGRVTLDETYDATVIARDDTLGLALLRPGTQLAPQDYARFQPSPIRLQSEVAVAGYSYEGKLSSPTMTYGTLEDVRGLNGEEAKSRLSLNASTGDAGGPVFDTSGAVLGMLLPESNPDGKRLPEGVGFSTDAAAIATFLSDNGANASASDRSSPMSGEDLAELAAKVTVLVSCWE